jgi:hypothetical protein
MLVPRRVRRRLLLPPGWVALGFLLLLGCQALQPWRRRLKQWNVIQLTMPPLKIKLEDVQQYGREYFMPYMALGELNKTRPWHNAEFTGKLLPDFFSAATTESAIQKIIADTSQAGGVRIRFLPGATYANLVKVLDIMNYTNQKKYFLDIHHRPTTLYAITDGPQLHVLKSSFIGGSCFIFLPPTPVKPSFKRLLASFEQEVIVLKNQSWRLPIMLLILLSGLNLWQLFYAILNRRNS